MGKQGQYNYTGINYQSWAAISLFLQYLKNPYFSYIHLEAPKFQDFNLAFEDGKKIICEAKNWEKNFSYPDLRKILKDILDRNNLGENDEILFICHGINNELKNRVKNAKYFMNTKYFKSEYYPFLKNKNFTDEQINILPKVKFWEISQEINENLIYSLFRELLDFWLPDDDIKKIVHSILIEKIYLRSAKGNVFTRNEIILQIENMKINIIKKTGYLDDARRNVYYQIKELINALEDNKSPIWADYNRAALTTKPSLMFFILKRIENKKIRNLFDWQGLWEIFETKYFTHSILKIFSSNLQNKNNRKYILMFILKYVQEYKDYFLKDILINDILAIINRIIEKDNSLIDIALEIIDNILDNYENNYFYQKTYNDEHREYEKEQIAALLRKLFKSGNYKQKEIIYSKVINSFNLVEDEGEFSHYTPRIVFEILKNYLVEDYSKFEKRFLQIIKDLVKQYDKVCQKHTDEYKGWEIISEFTVYSPNKYLIKDKHYIYYMLEPALNEYYKYDPEKAWNFILGNCIIRENKVNKMQPDFLNRASIAVILEQYINKNEYIANQAFTILKGFISSKKGIPSKRELIFQKIRKDFPSNKKILLIEEYIKSHKLPYDPFIEDNIIGLAKDGNKKAIYILEEWTNDPNFLKRTDMLGRDEVTRIENYLDFSFSIGLKLFKNYIKQDDFINNDLNIEVYRIANILNRIIYDNFQIGIEIIKSIIKNESLTNNQQIVVFYSLLPKSDNINKPENLEIFEKLYYEFLKPFLGNLNNEIENIERIISNPHAREAIVDLAKVLAKNKKIIEAMHIIEIFINDSDPCTPQKIDPRDPKGEYDKHRQITNGETTNIITTVRGKCAWALMNCIGLEGRKYIEKSIDLTENLANDENFYILEQACMPLSRLAQVRFSIMPENKKELFFHQDKAKALRMAKKVEKLALNLLERFLSLDHKPRNVLINQLLRVFNYLKSINQQSAKNLFDGVLKCSNEVISEAVPLLIYFTEFRHRLYHDWEWSLPGLFDNLSEFDNKYFKDILINLIKKENSKINAQFSWHFNEFVRNAREKTSSESQNSVIGYKDAFAIADYYLNIIAESYDKEAFERIYRFVKENIDKHFEKCYELWRKCLCEERDFIKRNLDSEDKRRMYWWPFDNNGEILEIIKANAGDNEFLESFRFLLDYPIKFYFPEIDKVLKILEELPKEYNKEVSELFQKLITKEPKYFDSYETWKKKL